MRVKKAILFIVLASSMTSICLLFWYMDIVYSLPTPVPQSLRAVKIGSSIHLPVSMNINDNRPVFLHFFNPDCPCSKFNISHVKSLVKQFHNEATFAIVVMSNKNYTAKQIQDKFQLQIPILFDTAIAGSCGVYSTPQAVLIDESGNLFYRGNYNKSRYCADKKSNYAQQALESLLNNKRSVIFNQYALTAYGCSLPNCKK